mgnify:CR=1 FL=1
MHLDDRSLQHPEERSPVCELLAVAIDPRIEGRHGRRRGARGDPLEGEGSNGPPRARRNFVPPRRLTRTAGRIVRTAATAERADLGDGTKVR